VDADQHPMVRSTSAVGGVIVEDVSVAGDADAWLVRPEEGSGLAGLVQWHWLDTEAPDGNRDEFLADARELAGQGFVSLLPQGRFPWRIDPIGSAQDARQIEAEVQRLILGIDLLAGLPGVDAGRLGFVGHDFGAMLGMVAAAREPRIRGLALVAPTPRWGDWFLPFWPIAEDRIDYLRQMRPLDPIEQMPLLAPRPVLLQFGQRDYFVPLMAARELQRAAASDETTELRSYDAGHDVRIDDARVDRLAFLRRTLTRGDSA
jgi:pimeloyl-ACP methyl ester carboxylesterase